MRFLILLLFPILINGQKLSEDEFNERLDSERGNFAIQNYEQDFLGRPGYLWMAMKSKKDNLLYMTTAGGGLLEYDGVKVRRLDLKKDTTYSFDGSFTRTLVQMDDGTIYVTGFAHFSRLVENKFGLMEMESLMNKLPDSIDYRLQQIWGMTELNNKIYFYTPVFIFRWDGDKFDKIWKFSDYAGGRSSKGKVHGFAKVDGTIYMRRWGYGVYKMVDDEFIFLENTELFGNNRIELFYKLKNGSLLFLSRNIGAYLYNPETKKLSKSKNNILNNWLIDNFVYVSDDLKSFSDGSIPIHSRGGLLIINDELEILNKVSSEDGLQVDNISAVFIDENQNVFLSSDQGASKINFDNSLTQYDKNNGIDGYLDVPIKRINGNLYFATNRDIFKLVAQKNPLKNNIIDQLGYKDIMTYYHKFDNSIMATHNYGLTQYENGKLKKISGDYEYRMSEQSMLNSDFLILAHRIDGLLIMKKKSDGNFDIYKTVQPKKGFGVFAFEEIEPGKLILNLEGQGGTYIAEYDKKANFKFTRLYHPKAENVNDKLSDSLISDTKYPEVFNWSKSNIGYIAFSDSLSVHKIDSENNKLVFTGINFSEISNDGVFGASYNPETKNNYWLSSSGINIIKLNKDFSSDINKFDWGEIDVNELSGQLFVEGKGENETFWLGSLNSKLIRWLPRKSDKKENKILPIFRGLYVDNELQEKSEIIELMYDSSRTIRLEYSYPVFNKEENNEYRVFLKGQDSDTSEWSKNSFREYTNLSEKDYEFLIQARDTNGNKSEFISFNFTILPPWYRTYAAYAGYIFLIVFGFRSFGKYQAQKSLEKADNERRAGELEEAKKIQESMLPKVFPTSKVYDISAGLVTSTEIGGDYYDFFENKNSIYAVCGDATGHGTSSGMMVSIIKSGLNGLPSLSTDKVLYELNNIVKKIDLGTLKMSLNICEIKNGSITLSSAAMPPIYLYNSKSKKTEEILIRGLPLGGLKNETFDIQKKKFNKGDVLVMLSDGLPEAENDAGELYDYERVMKLINKNASKTAEEIKDKMIGEVDIWLDGKVPDDDVSIVVVKKNS